LLAQGRTVVDLDYNDPGWSHPNLVCFRADLAHEGQTSDIARQIASDYAITALVNNAGATRAGSIDTATLADLDHVVGLHLRASLILIQAALPARRASGQGLIVNVSSRAALGKPERVVYSATKAGLIGLTRTLTRGLGGDDITVNALALGPIATDFLRQSNPGGSAADPENYRLHRG
jgi:3-oxoacyl-[acyl-carrier protein] reductase